MEIMILILQGFWRVKYDQLLTAQSRGSEKLATPPLVSPIHLCLKGSSTACPSSVPSKKGRRPSPGSLMLCAVSFLNKAIIFLEVLLAG